MSQVTLLARADISQVKKNRNCFSFCAGLSPGVCQASDATGIPKNLPKALDAISQSNLFDYKLTKLLYSSENI